TPRFRSQANFPCPTPAVGNSRGSCAGGDLSFLGCGGLHHRTLARDGWRDRGRISTIIMSLLFLVRHGQASFDRDDYDQLSPQGVEQARLLGIHWTELNLIFDHIYVGP